MMMKRNVASVFLVLAMACVAVACSDDTTDEGGTPTCGADESYNTLSGQCEPALRGDNNDPNNNDPNNNDPDNNDPDNNDPNSDAGTDDGTDSGDHTDTDDPDGDVGDNTNPGSDVAAPGCGPGAIIGKACAPSGETLAGADVTLEGFDCDGDPYTQTVQTNSDGDFQFNGVPSGRHTLTISTGSFSRNQTIVVQPGETLDLSTAAAKICLDGGNVDIAIIEGAYDHVSGVLDDLGLDYTVEGNDQPQGSIFNQTPPSGHTFLMDVAAMNQYDIIFINCGNLWDALQSTAPGDIATIISNLKTYLAGGKSLYVSDWAHPFIEKAYPDAIDFYGDDATTNEARRGYAPQTITASVTSPELQNVLGSSQATIDFPHSPPTIYNDHWVVAQGADASSTIHLSGDAQLCPSGGGTCNSASGSQAAAPLLATYKAPSGGTTIFTSFHNERQAAINQDMEKILKFLIFQL
jgi:hypothetical protein